MTDQEARDILSWFSNDPKLDRLDEVRNQVRSLIDNTNDIRVKGNLTPEFRGTEYDVYKDYVPLRSWTDEDLGDTDESDPVFARAGKGFKVRGKEDYSALGRERLTLLNM